MNPIVNGSAQQLGHVPDGKCGQTPVASRVLVVEDDLEVARSVAEMLKHLGYIPVTCDRPENALRLVESGKIDLMLVDYRMPEITGLDLVRMLREEHNNIPVVMMSGFAATEARVSFEKLEGFTMLKKPIDMNCLAKALADLLGARPDVQSE